jgi:thiamine biosynthesis lipoprotein
MDTAGSDPRGDARGQAQSTWSRRALFTGIPLRRAADTGFWTRISRRAMACSFEITLASEDACWVPAARAALDEVNRIEDRLTVFRDTSAVADLNRRAAAGPVEVDEDLLNLLQHCAALHHDTGGAFDVTSTPLSRCWGFLEREGRLPPADAIAAARAAVGFHHVVLDADARTVRFDRAGVELNFGAIGKGHALDRIAGGLRGAGVTHALLSAGRSSLLAIGGRHGGWHVDLVSPRVERPFARVWLRDAALGTSGAGEQFVVVDDMRYGHVIDPRSGWPASGVLSASVVASSAAAADALSTAFLVGGVDSARRYCSQHSNVLALITPEGHDSPIVTGHHPGALVEEA